MFEINYKLPGEIQFFRTSGSLHMSIQDTVKLQAVLWRVTIRPGSLLGGPWHNSHFC